MATSSWHAVLIVAVSMVVAVVASNLIIFVTDLSLPDYSARFDNYAFATGIPLAVAPLLVVPLAYAMRRKTELQAVLERNIRTDALTGLLNRRGFFDEAERILARSCKGAQPVAVMMVDVDRFKEVNDTFGHAAGDDLLRDIARCIRAAIGCESGHSVVARIGGDEFAVLLTGCDPSLVGATAERVCHAVRTAGGEGDHPAIPAPSVSIGAAMCLSGQPIDVVMKVADNAAYEAKRAGRDRWVLAAAAAGNAGEKAALIAA